MKHTVPGAWGQFIRPIEDLARRVRDKQLKPSPLIPPGGGHEFTPSEPPSGYFDREAVQRIQETLGPPQTISYTPIAAEFAKTYAPSPISGLPQDYFTTQRESMKEQLRQEIFGPTGQAQAAVSAESAAGRLGSGVGRRILEETVTRPFFQASTQIDRDIMQAQMQETARVQQFNAQQQSAFSNLMGQLETADSSNRLAANTANAQLQGQYAELTGRLADAREGRLTQEGIAQLDSDTRVFIASQDAYIKTKTLQEEARRSEIEFFKALGAFKPETPEQEAAARSLARQYDIPYTPETPSERTLSKQEVGAKGLPTKGRYPGETRVGADGITYNWDPGEPSAGRPAGWVSVGRRYG